MIAQVSFALSLSNTSMTTIVLARAGTDDRRMDAEYLRAHGFRVHEAETTDAALGLIDTCQLLITGLLVPRSIDGVAFVDRAPSSGAVRSYDHCCHGVRSARRPERCQHGRMSRVRAKPGFPRASARISAAIVGTPSRTSSDFGASAEVTVRFVAVQS